MAKASSSRTCPRGFLGIRLGSLARVTNTTSGMHAFQSWMDATVYFDYNVSIIITVKGNGNVGGFPLINVNTPNEMSTVLKKGRKVTNTSNVSMMFLLGTGCVRFRVLNCDNNLFSSEASVRPIRGSFY